MSRYEEYQETGFDWLGKIPSNWGLSRVGKFFTERSEKVDDVTYPPLSVTMSGIVDQLSDVAKTNDGGNRKLVKKHDFVINSRSDRKGSSGISPRDGSVSLINIVLEPRELDPQFIQYLFKNYYFKEEYFRNGKGIHWDLWTTRWDQLKNIKFPIPSNKEQELISRYLDKKTEQIDSLIEKIQKKIELLKEQRTSLINQCVTKGLDPKVEMKDSGVEWIGEIPSHWYLKRLKYLVSYNQETLSENTEPDYEFNYIEIGDVNYVEGISINDKTSFSESPSRARRVVRPNDVIVSTVRTYLRSIGVVPNLDNVICSTGFCVLRDNTGLVDQRFLSYSVRSEWFVSEVISNSYGVSYPAINSSELIDIGIVIPSIDEQKKIVNFIDLNIKKIDHEIQHEERRKTLIKEYRQSLISSVVTGKVRVTEDLI